MNGEIEFLVDIGIDCISGLQPKDGGGDVVLSDVKNRYGDSVSLMGGIDPCYTFDLGSVETVRAAAQKAIDDAAQGGGYILAPAKSLQPETPTENAAAVFEAFTGQ